jgi:cysteine synthase
MTEATVLTCCGGGGLTSGIALALEARAPGMRVRPVEPEGSTTPRARSPRAGSCATTAPRRVLRRDPDARAGGDDLSRSCSGSAGRGSS